MSLGKILSSSVKVNTQAGNPRKGKTYIDARDAAGNVVHRYDLAGKGDVAFTKTAPGVPAVTASSAQVTTARGGLVNQIKGSARFGQSYTVATRGGLRGHLYGKTFIPMGAVKK